jgi:hypothetical protein
MNTTNAKRREWPKERLDGRNPNVHDSGLSIQSGSRVPIRSVTAVESSGWVHPRPRWTVAYSKYPNAR